MSLLESYDSITVTPETVKDTLITDNKHSTKKLALLSQSNMQNHWIIQLINQINNVECEIITETISLTQINCDLAIVDCQYHSLESLQLLVQALYQQTPIALINAPDRAEYEKFVQWPHTFGYFPADTSAQQLGRGLNAIIAGDVWIPRRIMSTLIQSYRKPPIILDPKAHNLSRREKQVLEYLIQGASNIEIADSLCVSEHTVKSHLYTVYKKLEVRNRLQACNWAKKHMDFH